MARGDQAVCSIVTHSEPAASHPTQRLALKVDVAANIRGGAGGYLGDWRDDPTG